MSLPNFGGYPDLHGGHFGLALIIALKTFASSANISIQLVTTSGMSHHEHGWAYDATLRHS